jgi:hypothetical protein
MTYELLATCFNCGHQRLRVGVRATLSDRVCPGCEKEFAPEELRVKSEDVPLRSARLHTPVFPS